MSLVKGVDGVKAPATFMLHGLRPTFQRLVNSRWQIELHGEDKVPTSGPVILAANHIGLLDGPLLAIVSPRPAHVMTKREMFTGPMSAFLVGSGQIPLNREGVDVEAILGAQLVLTRGGAVGIFTEGERGAGDVHSAKGGAAYLGLRSGAPIVPVALLGTRAPGEHKGYVPPKGTRISLSYGDPLRFDAIPFPRQKSTVDEATEVVKQALIATVDRAQDLTGMSLPGPLGDSTHG